MTKGLQESKTDPRFIQAVVPPEHFDARVRVRVSPTPSPNLNPDPNLNLR